MSGLKGHPRQGKPLQSEAPTPISDRPRVLAQSIASDVDPAGGSIGWRSDAERILVWFGDAPGHDPVCAAISGLGFDITEATLTVKLQTASLAVVAIGGVVWLGDLSWFGRLPGDLRIERDGLRVFIPLTSMLVISVVLSLVAALLRRVW